MIYSSGVLENVQWHISIDLKSDYIKIMERNLPNIEFINLNSDKYFEKLFYLYSRLISPFPRSIIKSKEFSCPGEYEKALDELEKKIVNGESLIPYLSEKITDLNYNDKLLNDWNIYHLHLSRRFRQDGFAKRSDFELFIYVTDYIIYFIQIYPHSKEDLYSTQDMVRIIYDNWPDLIEKYRIKDIISLSENLDDKSYGELRDLNMGLLVQVRENNVFGLIGGGYASNGFSLKSLRAADHWKEKLKNYELIIVNNINSILYVIEQVTNSMINKLDFNALYFDSENEITMLEKNNCVIIQMNFQEHIMRAYMPIDIYREKFKWSDCLKIKKERK